MRHLRDEELIGKSTEGDQRAFAELVRRYQQRVTVTIKSVIGDLSQDDLADIAQDIFVLIYKALPSFRAESQFGTYITRIALRHCYREAKKRKRKKSLFFSYNTSDEDGSTREEQFAGTEETDKPVLAEEQKHAVLQAMESLAEEFRIVLALRIVEEMPVEDVAKALGVSTGTVKSRLYRAKEKMRELLSHTDLDFDPDPV